MNKLLHYKMTLKVQKHQVGFTNHAHFIFKKKKIGLFQVKNYNLNLYLNLMSVSKFNYIGLIVGFCLWEETIVSVSLIVQQLFTHPEH